MATADIEAERARMLDERRKAGDNAWSPSRAREALRGWARCAIGGDESLATDVGATLKRAEAGHLVSRPAFLIFCDEEIGYCPL